MRPRGLRTGDRPNPGNPHARPDETAGSSAGHYLSIPNRLYYNSADYPRPVCPECGSGYTFIPFAGFFTETPRLKPSWLWPVGCVETPYDRFCAHCEWLWCSDGSLPAMFADDPRSMYPELMRIREYFPEG